jgi:hypothetical protein
MKFTGLILSLLLFGSNVNSQNSNNSDNRSERLRKEISGCLILESKGFGPFGFETSEIWRKADTLLGMLSLQKVLYYFSDSSYTLKYYSFLRVLLLNDEIAYKLLTSKISDSTHVLWHFDDEMGSERINQLLATEYKIFIQLKYHNGGKIIESNSHYFGSGTYYFPKFNKKIWSKKYSRFSKMVSQYGVKPM